MRGFKSYQNKVDGVIHYYDLKRRSNRIGIVAIYIICILMAIVFLYPMIWLIFACLKDSIELFKSSSLLPKVVDWDGLRRTWLRLVMSIPYLKEKTIPSCAARMICCLPCWLKLMP